MLHDHLDIGWLQHREHRAGRAPMQLRWRRCRLSRTQTTPCKAMGLARDPRSPNVTAVCLGCRRLVVVAIMPMHHRSATRDKRAALLALSLSVAQRAPWVNWRRATLHLAATALITSRIEKGCCGLQSLLRFNQRLAAAAAFGFLNEVVPHPLEDLDLNARAGRLRKLSKLLRHDREQPASSTQQVSVRSQQLWCVEASKN